MPDYTERIARARYHGPTATPWTLRLSHSRLWLNAIETAGLTVVDLPETRQLSSTTAGTGGSEDSSDVWAALLDSGAVQVVVGGDAGVWCSIDDAERDALRALAVVAELRRMRGDHDA